VKAEQDAKEKKRLQAEFEKAERERVNVEKRKADAERNVRQLSDAAENERTSRLGKGVTAEVAKEAGLVPHVIRDAHHFAHQLGKLGVPGKYHLPVRIPLHRVRLCKCVPTTTSTRRNNEHEDEEAEETQAEHAAQDREPAL
jgi:hypothetical protein